MAKQEKKFSSGMEKATAGEVDGNTPVMIAVNGIAKQFSLGEFKNHLELTGTELIPIASGLLPTPLAGQIRTMDVVGPGTWTHPTLTGGASLLAGQTGKLFFSGGVWSLRNVVDLPKQDVSDKLDAGGFVGTAKTLDDFKLDKSSVKSVIGKNKFNVNDYINDTTITSNGSLNSGVGSVGGRTSKPIDISAFNNFALSNKYGVGHWTGGRRCIFLNSEGVYIPNSVTELSFTASRVDYIFSKITGAKYFQFTFKRSDETEDAYKEFQLEDGISATNFESYKNEVTEIQNLPLLAEKVKDNGIIEVSGSSEKSIVNVSKANELIEGKTGAIKEDIDYLKSTVLIPILTTIGQQPIDSTSVSSSTNRTRIDGNFPSTVNGPINNLNIACNVGGPGTIKLVSRKADGTYTIKKEVPFNFLEGVNKISRELWSGQEIAIGDTFGFQSQTASFAMITDNSKLTYYCSGNLTNSTVAGSIIASTGIIKFNYSVEVGQEDKVAAVDREVMRVSEVTDTLALSPCYYKFEKNGNGAGKGKFTVYCQILGNIYIAHHIGFELNLADNVFQNYWRYIGCSSAIFNGSTFTLGDVLITSQESEFVYQEVGRDDFTGGYHGDEILTDIYFYASGQLVPINDDIPLTASNGFQYIENSTMHEAPTKTTGVTGGVPNTAHPEQAKHIKITSFNTKGYVTKNIVTWSKAITLTQYYSGICCVGRNVAKTAFTDKDYVNRDLDTYDNTLLGGAGLRIYKAQNPSTKFSISVNSSVLQGGLKLVDILQVLVIRDNGFPQQYKKYYRGIPSNIVTAVGERWETEMQVTFEHMN